MPTLPLLLSQHGRVRSCDGNVHGCAIKNIPAFDLWQTFFAMLGKRMLAREKRGRENVSS
jgi:hypothetical protein